MNQDEREACRALILKQLSREQFLAKFPSAPADRELAVLERLQNAYDTQDEDGTQYSVLIGHVLGFSNVHVPLLCNLLDCDWHHSHEDIVSALDRLRDARAIPFLKRIALKNLPYLDYESDYRALSNRAMWALTKIGDESAVAALRELQTSDQPIVAALAAERLADVENKS
jgi:hypothetical protein